MDWPLLFDQAAVIVGLVPTSPAWTSSAYSHTEPVLEVTEASRTQLLDAPSSTLVGTVL